MPSMPGIDIGGAYVRRAFLDNETRLPVGATLSAAKVKSWPRWKQLEKVGFIVTWPAMQGGIASHSENDTERFTLHEGFGRYSVIEGRKLNDGPLTKEEAEKLATGA